MAKTPLDPVTEKTSILYEIARVLAAVVFNTFLPARCIHREKLDAEAPYVVIANHRHALDPVAMAYFIRKRQIVFLGKKELGKGKLVTNILTRMHCILVDRHNTDMNAMRSCMKAVKMKKILLIFPEGTRHHEGQMEQIESGTAMIALRSKCPIIPIYFDRKLSLFRRTNLIVGDPIPTEDLQAEGINTETCEKMNERLRETFRGMVREYGDKKS